MTAGKHVAVIVPWRDKGDEARRAALKHVSAHLVSTLGKCVSPGDVVAVHVTDDGGYRLAPFNRSAAYNRGVAARPDSDVYVFHEADMIIPPEQLARAVTMAAGRPGLVVPFTAYHYLSQASSQHVIEENAPPGVFAPERVMADGRSVGAVNVVSRAAMTAVGQWDEGFEGWGFDDRAMARAFSVCCACPTRFVPGPGFHLWHEPGWAAGGEFAGGSATLSPVEQTATERNRARYRLYRSASTPWRMRQLTMGAAH